MTELDKRLYALIKAGDTIVTSEAMYEAESGVSIRIGTNYQHAIVPVYMSAFIIPINTTQIEAVYRNGVCLYERGVTPLQRGLWE